MHWSSPQHFQSEETMKMKVHEQTMDEQNQSVCTMPYYTTIRRNYWLTDVIVYMDLEKTILGERH